MRFKTYKPNLYLANRNLPYLAKNYDEHCKWNRGIVFNEQCIFETEDEFYIKMLLAFIDYHKDKSIVVVEGQGEPFNPDEPYNKPKNEEEQEEPQQEKNTIKINEILKKIEQIL